MSNTGKPFRADHVGSLLRTPELLAARNQFANKQITREQLRAAEDASIKHVVKLQEEAGLDSITDGEQRRDWWHVDFLCGFDGVNITEGSWGVDFHGTKHDEQPPIMAVTEPIRRTKPNMLDHFTYLKSVTTKTPKFSMPAPGMLHARGERASLHKTYPDLDLFWADLTTAYNQEMMAMYAAGCRYFQIDDTTVAMMGDPKVRDQFKSKGDDPDQTIAMYTAATNMAIKGLPADATVAIHTCRGNFKSTWMASGGYDSVADTVFGRLNVNAFFLEYDDERSGGFEPLRFVPKGKRVVLGLVSSKLPKLESKDELKRRIDEAAKYVPKENLCISPQCGFSSTHHGNVMSEDDQKRKLALCVEVAHEVWGST